ncbi:DnaB helicase C-terminal domain-containing protein [Campylobacter showae]|uniref:DnaB helicase C-terminal domain-containing protein n=1 Tax=Campylobacter showae TaxID=204 RepID=UPI001F13B2E2|nr:DnaB helicase C-terminal domain-containing protein [Campylobacter showae]
MKFNERIDYERTILSTYVFSMDLDEVAQYLKNGLDESLFSGVRIKIAREINAKIKEGLDYHTLGTAMSAYCNSDEILLQEYSDIISYSPINTEKAFLWLIKELREISVLNETLKKLSKTDLPNKSEITKGELENAYEILGSALGKINDLDDEGDEGENMGEFVKRVEKNRDLKFYPTGLRWLDIELAGAGLAEGSFINIAGGSFAGKTTFTLELLKSMAQSEKVCFFSYEMYEKILIRKFKFASWDVLQNIQIYQDGAQIDKIAARIRKLSKKGYKIFAIDSRMKIRVSNDKASEYEKNNEISSKLSELTRTLGVIVILINQISEADLKAGRNSLKGSGDQVYDSDMIIYLKATTNDRKEVVKREFEMAKDRIGERLFKVNIPDFYKKEPQEVYFNEELAI